MGQYIADTQPYILNLVSTKRDNFPSSSSTKFRMKLSYPILYANKVRLLTATLPNTLIVFNRDAPYKINTWIDFIDSSLTQKSYQLPTGTYSYDQLKPILEAGMNASSGLDTYTLNLDPNTLLLTITSSNPIFQLLWVTGSHSNQNMYYELGYNLVDTVVSQNQLANRVLQLSGYPNIYVQFVQLKNCIHDPENFTSTFQIPLDVPFGDIKYWKANTEYDTSIDIQLKNLTVLEVNLISEFGEINLQNSDWSMLLEFRNEPL